MQGSRHAHGAEVCGPVTAGTHLVEFGQSGDLFEMRDASGMDNRRADVVDELFLNQNVAVVDRVKYLSHGQRSGSVTPDDPEPLLQLGWCCIFEPEEMIGFKFFAQARCFDGAEPMMRVVQQMNLRAKLLAQPGEELRRKIQIVLG